jgi:hypothetical protein
MTRAAEIAKIIGKGSVDIHGEAGTTSSGSTGLTTNLQQGLLKCFMDLNGTSTISLHDSFNISSVADGGTGIYTASMNNDFANVNYGWAGSGENANDGQNGRSVTAISLGALAGSTEVYCSSQSTNSAEDLTHIRVGWWGDLA